jgi:hypothetical protein
MAQHSPQDRQTVHTTNSDSTQYKAAHYKYELQNKQNHGKI